MKNIFIGGLFTKGMEKEIVENSKGVVHYAANVHQINLLNAIKHSMGELVVVSALTIGPYPMGYNKISIGSCLTMYDSVEIHNVRFNNLWGYKLYSRKNSIFNKLEELVDNETRFIYVYSTHTPYLESAIRIRKKYPSIKICLIVPDLPQFMNLTRSNSIVYKNLKKLDNGKFETLLLHVDSFIILTEQMKKPLKIGNRPYIVIEGISSIESTTFSRKSSLFGDNYVLYSGTLNESFGVMSLIKAFKLRKIRNNKLIICGAGECATEIAKVAKENDDILFLGQITNDEVLELQKGALFLVNPRKDTDEFTKYSFPSKIIEYLTAGRPILCYNLAGIPKEYDNYLNYIEDNSDETFSKAIDKLLSKTKSELNLEGRENSVFVSTKKDFKSSSLKIKKMMEE